MPGITRIKVGEAVTDHVGMLASQGALIIEGAAPPSLLATILSELEPFLAATSRGRDDFAGTDTTRTGAIAARSPAARTLITNPDVLALANALLLPECAKIQLMLTQIIRLLPGQGEQPLHRDRFVWGPHMTAREPQLSTIWAMTDFTSGNGATRIAPGSPGWSPERTPSVDDLEQAEMAAGSVLVFTGNVLHGGGGNATGTPRVGLNINYCLGWLRQEENQYLSCPPRLAKALDPGLQELLGYSMPNYALGYFSDPDLADVAEAGVHLPQAALGIEGARMGGEQKQV